MSKSQHPGKPAKMSIATTRSILKRELGFNRERLSIQFRIRIDEVVERIALLRWVEADISSNSKLQAIVVMRPEEIVFLVWMFPSFRRVNRDPAVGHDIEFRPAVISRYSPIMLISRQRKTYFEARRNSGRPHHADKQRVEISAVATLGRAGPYRISVAPAGAGLVVAHRGDNEVVDCSRFLQRVSDSTRLLRSELRDDSLEGHAAIRLKETLETWRVYFTRLRTDCVGLEPDAMFMAGYFKAHAHFFKPAQLFRRNLPKKVLVGGFPSTVL